MNTASPRSALWLTFARGGAWAHVTALPVAAVLFAWRHQWPICALAAFGVIVGVYILWDTWPRTQDGGA